MPFISRGQHCTRSARRISPIVAFTMAGGLLLACSDDGNDGNGANTATAAQQLAEELAEEGIELTDGELQDAAELLDDGGQGQASVTFDGEALKFTSVVCADDEIMASGPAGVLDVSFRLSAIDLELDFDAARVALWRDLGDSAEVWEHDRDAGDARLGGSGSPRGATGTAQLARQDETATIDFDLDCDG